MNVPGFTTVVRRLGERLSNVLSGNRVAIGIKNVIEWLSEQLLDRFGGNRDLLAVKIVKVLTVVGPGLYVWILESIRHGVFGEKYSDLQLNFALALLVTAGAYGFSRVIFGEIESIQRQVVRQNEELTVLNTVASAVNQSLSLDVVLQTALEKIIQVTKADAAELFLLDEKTNELTLTARAGQHKGMSDKARFNLGEGLVGGAALRGEPLLIEDVQRSPALVGTTIRSSGFHSLACIPLRSQNVTVGVFSVATLTHRRYCPEDMRLLVDASTHIAVAIENARLHQRVQAAAAIEERERLAREMHDGVAQVLSYINVKTQAVKSFLAVGQVAATQSHLQELEDTCQEAYADIRESILGLRLATAHESLYKAIQEYIVRFHQMSNLKIAFEADETAIPPLSPVAEVQIIRIIQEALTNVRKHAGATKASVQFAARTDRFCVTIEDDGHGFDLRRNRKGDWPQFGLQTMKERAECIKGTLDVFSTPGRGTIVQLKVPVMAVG